ncbi:MAG: hypothetical protein WC553_03660 [Patescibacteria group bacterium]|jgi:hypothetical protein
MAIESGYPSEYPRQEQPKSERERLDMAVAETEGKIRHMLDVVPDSALLGVGSYELAVSYNKRVIDRLRAELEDRKRRRDELDGQTRQESEVEQTTASSTKEQTSGEAGGEVTTQAGDAVEVQSSSEAAEIKAAEQTLENLYNDSEAGGPAS